MWGFDHALEPARLDDTSTRTNLPALPCHVPACRPPLWLHLPPFPCFLLPQVFDVELLSFR